MASYVDYSKLGRRELQALCKQHRIPANKTNVFMAEALDALLNNAPRQQEEFQEEELPAPDSPEVEKVVEKVKGKRVPKKALLPEPELDSLAGLLASSSLNSSVQGAMAEQGAVPENVSEAVPSEYMLPPAPLLAAPKAKRGRPRQTKKEERVIETRVVESAETGESTVDAGVEGPTSEVADEATMDAPLEWAEPALKADSLPVGAVQADIEQPAEELPKVTIRIKNSARKEMVSTTEMVAVEESDKKEDREDELSLSSTEADTGMEDVAAELIADEADERVEYEDEVPDDMLEDVETISTFSEVEPERDFVEEPVVETEEKSALPPRCAEEKKSRKLKKKGGSKSRRNPEAQIEAEVEVTAAMEEEAAPAWTSLAAEVETATEVDATAQMEETEETALPPVQDKKNRRPKKAGSKSRRNAEIEVEVEGESSSEMNDKGVPEAESTGRPPKGGAVGEEFSWTSPPSVLEEELPPLRHNSFTISPSVPKEKPKVRKTKKATGKTRRKAELPEEEPEIFDDKQMDWPNMEAEKKNSVEPITPVKKMEANGVADDKENEKDALLNLSMRKLVKKCREKGLKTRGTNTTRSINL